MLGTRRIAEAVLLLTDVVDSTRITAALGDEAMERIWRQHDAAARALLSRWRGVEVDRTDGFLLLFEAVNDAVGFAGGFHEALRALSERCGVPLRARAAVHVGPALLLENSEEDRARGAKSVELEGLAKPIAARVMSVAPGGQTLLSAAAMEQLTLTGLRTRSHGLWRMKGVEQPIELFGVLGPEGTVTPPEENEKVWRVVETAEGWRPARNIPSRLPAERDAFVGRERELRQLFEALEGGARVLTLLGPGGVGKSRLALRFGRIWLGDWPGGVWFCDLAEARDPAALARVVAETLDVPLGREEPAVQLGRVLAARGRCLVVLDGVEFVAEALSALLDRWLDQAPEARFLVTSRARLRARGEAALPLEPLDPELGLALVLARVQAHSPGTSFDARAQEDIRGIVRLLDGLPLALELAAARARVLGPTRIRERLADRFALLVGGRAAPRQTTLRATMDWSWELLPPPARAALAQLSVFEGGFSLEAAEAVLDLSDWPEAAEPWELLETLEAQSLIRPLGSGSGRFGMLDVIRAYAAERLRGSPDLPPRSGGAAAALAAEERHGRFFAALGGEDLRAAIHGPTGTALRRALALEIGNLEAATLRAVARADAAVAVEALARCWAVFGFRGPFRRGLALAEAVCGLPLEGRARVHALGTRATTRLEAGAVELAQQDLELAVREARAGDHWVELAPLLGDLGVVSGILGDVEGGLALLGEALEVARRHGLRRDQAANLVRLGNLRWQTGDTEEGLGRYEEALPHAVAVGDRATEGILHVNIGMVHAERGRAALAEPAYQRALTIAREIGAPKSEAIALGNLGALLASQERLEEAERTLEAALAIDREIGNRVEEGIVACNLAAIARIRGDGAAVAHWTALAAQVGREVGNPRILAAALDSEAVLLLEAGRPAEALARVREAEEIVRRARFGLDLATLLALKGRVHVALGDRAAARACLDESERVARAMGAGPDAPLGRALEALRADLGESGPPDA